MTHKLGGPHLALNKTNLLGGLSVHAQSYNMLKDQLLDYAQAAFTVDPKDHQRLMGEVAEEKVSQESLTTHELSP